MTFLPYSAPLRYQLAIFFNRVLPSSVAPLLEHYFISARSSPQSAQVVLGTVLVSVTGAAGVLGTLMEGFRRAYLLTDDSWGLGWRGQVRRFAWSMLLVPISLVPLTVASLLIVFGHFLLPALRMLLPVAMSSTMLVVANTVRWTGAVAVMVAVLACIFRYGLPVRPAWRRASSRPRSGRTGAARSGGPPATRASSASNPRSAVFRARAASPKRCTTSR